MSKENEELRNAVKGVEAMAQNCLASQPDDDIKCYEHLFKGLSDVFGLAARVLANEIQRITAIANELENEKAVKQ